MLFSPLVYRHDSSFESLVKPLLRLTRSFLLTLISYNDYINQLIVQKHRVRSTLPGYLCYDGVRFTLLLRDILSDVIKASFSRQCPSYFHATFGSKPETAR